MKKIGEIVCKHKILIIILTFLLLIPTIIGIYKTRINYDILVYLPDDIETIKGQDILTEDFNMGAFSIAIIDNMNSKDVLKMEDKIKKVDGVEKVVSINDLTGTSIPISMFPTEVVDKVKKGDSEVMLITFKDSTSDDNTLDAVTEIKSITKDSCKLGGMSSMVLDTMNLSNQEIAIYIVIAVALCIIVLMLSLDSYFVPVLLLGNIGIAILFNMGTNVFLGNISYITKAISAVLQLGVTTDFSIFLYHKYEKEKKNKVNKTKEEAMSKAISETLVSVTGSSLTTIAGFLALCTMTLTLGTDIGIVMAKGVLLGVICVVTLFPSLLLIFDKLIDKTLHKSIVPQFTHIKEFVIKHYKLIFVIFLLLIVPAWYGNSHTQVYYNLDRSLPKTLDSSIANSTLKEKFNIVSPEIILVENNVKNNDLNNMINEIKKIDGIDLVLSPSSLSSLGISEDFLSEDLVSIYKSDKYQMVFVNSTYNTATNKLNNQISKMNKIVKKYDKGAIIAGEGPLMKDLVEISDKDFHNVNYTSLAVIFIIMILVLKSVSLPVILVSAIELAIFINMGIPYYTGATIPFVSSIVIGTIQLGATIDYAILMTTKYLEVRKTGKDKFASIKIALDNSVNSIFVSGMCFFAATIGVGLYSKLEMISSLCTLISRGALISMAMVILVLPSLLLVFDKLICKTSLGFGGKNMKSKKAKKLLSLLILISIIAVPNVKAVTKDETVYTTLNTNGSVKKTIVTDQLKNTSTTTEDVTNLKNILNINGNESFKLNGNLLTWNSNNNDIYYQGQIDKELPITTKITYKLNGKTKKLKNIIGKKGNVTITINYINNEEHNVTINNKNEKMYTPFVVTMGTIIPTKNNKNITVTNGKVISNGNNNIIVALATPGLGESLNIENLNNMNTITINYDTTKFELSSLYNVMTPKVLSNSDLSVFNKLDSLYDKATLLSTSSSQLLDGTRSLVNGVNSLKNGTSLLYNGTKEAYNGSALIKEQIDNAISNLENDNTPAIDNNTINYIKANARANATLEDTKKAYIGEQAVASVKESDTYKGLLDKYNYYDNLSTQLQSLINESRNNNEEAKALAYESQMNQVIQAKTTYATMMTLMEETAKTTAVSTAQQVAYSTAEEVSEAVAKQVATTAKETAKTTTVNQLTTLTSALSKLNSGLNSLLAGNNDLNNGVNTLLDGSNTLNQGMEKFDAEGIKVLNSYVNGNLKGLQTKLNALTKLSNEYDTFTMKEKNTSGETKFITVVNGIKKNK